MKEGGTLDPRWLAHRYDESTDQVRFVDYGRQERSEVPFLTDEYLPARNFRAFGRNEARAAAPATAPLHFIFHSGFCCSTLLAACFDQPGLATTFSEPVILNDAVGWRQRGAAPAAVGKLLDDALSFLARPFAGDQASVVKPSTVVNGLAPAMLQLRPEAGAVFIHAPLRDFVTSIAKKGIDGRMWARELLFAMRRERLTDPLGMTDEDFLKQTDLQVAASAWLGQQALFTGLQRAGGDRLLILNSTQFLAEPEQTLRALAERFVLPISDAQVEHALSVTMKRNSKDRSAYSQDDRRADYQAAASAHGDEIDKVCVWAAAVAQAMQLPMTGELRPNG